MDNLFFLEAKCVKCGKTFYPRYDLAADDCWVLTYGEKELPVGQQAVGSNGPNIKITKRRTGPQYKCPWCRNTDFVRCGRCGKITCHDIKTDTFSCAHCGNNGKITGTISDDAMKDMVKSSGSGQR